MLKEALLTGVLIAFALPARALSPGEIIQKIDATERVASSKGLVRQIITTSGGEKRTLEMEYYTRDRNDKQLMIYTAPKRVRGDKILMLDDGDDIWFYTPKTDRVRHLASHARRQRVQGSDFAYEDMAGGSLEEDYTCTLLGEEKIHGAVCYKFELIPTESGPHYTRLVLWAEKEKFISRRIDYYEDDEVVKQLNLHDIKRIDKHWCALRLVMANLKEGGQTAMETVEIEFDLELDDTIFTTRHLKRN